MDAQRRILSSLDLILHFMHAARRRTLSAAVLATVIKRQCWLSALGRNLDSGTSPKHRIKRIDRLLGNPHLQAEQLVVYRSLCAQLLQDAVRCIVLVDWTEVTTTHWALSASIPVQGRAIPIYQQVYERAQVNQPHIHERFIRELRRVLPQQAKPIVVTDAGFLCPWFTHMCNQGWDFVGRLCAHMQLRPIHECSWNKVRNWFARATTTACSLGPCQVTKSNKFQANVILVANTPKGRSHLHSRFGSKPSNTSVIHTRYKKRAREPWVLVTSLANETAHEICQLYALRMRCEQCFRDTKNHRYGLSLRDTRTRSAERLNILLLIAAMALFVTTILGACAEAANVHLRCQANTLRNRRVLSWPVLAMIILASPDPWQPSSEQWHHAQKRLLIQPPDGS